MSYVKELDGDVLMTDAKATQQTVVPVFEDWFAINRPIPPTPPLPSPPPTAPTVARPGLFVDVAYRSIPKAC